MPKPARFVQSFLCNILACDGRTETDWWTDTRRQQAYRASMALRGKKLSNIGHNVIPKIQPQTDRQTHRHTHRITPPLLPGADDGMKTKILVEHPPHTCRPYVELSILNMDSRRPAGLLLSDSCCLVLWAPCSRGRCSAANAGSVTSIAGGGGWTRTCSI